MITAAEFANLITWRSLHRYGVPELALILPVRGRSGAGGVFTALAWCAVHTALFDQLAVPDLVVVVVVVSILPVCGHLITW